MEERRPRRRRRRRGTTTNNPCVVMVVNLLSEASRALGWAKRRALSQRELMSPISQPFDGNRKKDAGNLCSETMLLQMRPDSSNYHNFPNRFPSICLRGHVHTHTLDGRTTIIILRSTPGAPFISGASGRPNKPLRFPVNNDQGPFE